MFRGSSPGQTTQGRNPDRSPPKEKSTTAQVGFCGRWSTPRVGRGGPREGWYQVEGYSPGQTTRGRNPNDIPTYEVYQRKVPSVRVDQIIQKSGRGPGLSRNRPSALAPFSNNKPTKIQFFFFLDLFPHLEDRFRFLLESDILPHELCVVCVFFEKGWL